MLVVRNERYPSIYTDVGSTQKVSIYINKKDSTYTPRFHVNNYNPTGKKKHGQRSFGKFPNLGEAFKWANSMCSHLTCATAHDANVLKVLNKLYG